MTCPKLFGERIMSREPGRRTAEIRIRITIMNRVSALGTAKIDAIVRPQAGKGQLTPQDTLCNVAA